MALTILFLCTGNIGRSPLAAGLARHRLAEALGLEAPDLERQGIRVWSAGTLAPEGMKPSPKSVAVAAERGVDVGDHMSTRLTPAMAHAADRIFCMDDEQLASIATLGVGDRADLLDPGGLEIPDPRGRDLDFYRVVRERIEAALEARVPELLQEAAGADS